MQPYTNDTNIVPSGSLTLSALNKAFEDIQNSKDTPTYYLHENGLHPLPNPTHE